MTLLIALISVVGVSLGGTNAFASDDVNNVVELSKGSGNAAGVVGSINEATNDTILSYDSKNGLVKFNNVRYSKFDLKQKNDFMDKSLSAVKQSSLNTKDKNKLFNFIADQDSTTSTAIRNLKVDAQADIASAAAWYKPFSGGISTLLGVLALATMLFLGITTVIDVAYLAVPMFRIFLDKDDRNERPKLISQEAYKVVIDSENETTGSYMGLYLRRRAITMIVVGLAIAYLISGSIFDIIAFFFDAGQPFLDQLR